jgi:hypothetical protein
MKFCRQCRYRLPATRNICPCPVIQIVPKKSGSGERADYDQITLGALPTSQRGGLPSRSCCSCFSCDQCWCWLVLREGMSQLRNSLFATRPRSDHFRQDPSLPKRPRHYLSTHYWFSLTSLDHNKQLGRTPVSLRRLAQWTQLPTGSEVSMVSGRNRRNIFDVLMEACHRQRKERMCYACPKEAPAVSPPSAS